MGGILYQEGPDEDVPLPFKGQISQITSRSSREQEDVSQFVDFLVARIRTFLSETRMNPSSATPEPSPLKDWLGDYLGSDKTDNRCVAVIDFRWYPQR